MSGLSQQNTLMQHVRGLSSTDIYWTRGTGHYSSNRPSDLLWLCCFKSVSSKEGHRYQIISRACWAGIYCPNLWPFSAASDVTVWGSELQIHPSPSAQPPTVRLKVSEARSFVGKKKIDQHLSFVAQRQPWLVITSKGETWVSVHC